ncbi:MAG: hypothetical protein ACMUEM_00565 [Flavobacteriales bacterium AspAUS03]
MIALRPNIDQIKECLIILKYLENSAAPALLKPIQENTPEKTTEVNHSKSVKTTINTTDESFNPIRKKTNYHPIRIDFNDKITFFKELLSGDQVTFDRMISDLNEFNIYQDAKQLVKNWTAVQDQPKKEPYLKRLITLINQRFNR